MTLALANATVSRAEAYRVALVRREFLRGETITVAADDRLDALLDAAYTALPADVRERVDADNVWAQWANETATVYAAVVNRRLVPGVYALRDGLQARWSAGTNERTAFAVARWNRLRRRVQQLNHEIEAKERVLYVARMAELENRAALKALVVVAAEAAWGAWGRWQTH